MAQILVRGVPDDVIERIKARAQLHGRSLESEVRSILESASGATSEQVRDVIARWDERFEGRKFVDSCELLTEDRSR